jgi:hypothetical protein
MYGNFWYGFGWVHVLLQACSSLMGMGVSFSYMMVQGSGLVGRMS